MVNDSSQILQKKWGPRGYVNGSPTTFQKFVDFMGLKDKGTVCTYVGILICIIVSCTFIELVRCRFEIESSKLQRNQHITKTSTNNKIAPRQLKIQSTESTNCKDQRCQPINRKNQINVSTDAAGEYYSKHRNALLYGLQELECFYAVGEDSDKSIAQNVSQNMSQIVLDFAYQQIVITMQASRLQADDTMIDDKIASLKEFFELPEVSEFYISQGSKKDKKEYYRYEVKHKVQIPIYRRTISISFVVENFESLVHGGVKIKDFNVWEIEERLKDHTFTIYWESKIEGFEEFDQLTEKFESFVNSAEKSTIYFRDHEHQLSHPSLESGYVMSLDDQDNDSGQDDVFSFSVVFDDTDRSPDIFLN
eukprot:53620_1